MSTFLFDKIVFGPVKSRRLGTSLGINLLPNDCKLCNFNCIYCECGWTPGIKNMTHKFHSRQRVNQELEKKLQQMKHADETVDAITFAGNGEPTMHPDFPGIIDDTIQARNVYFKEARIVVLSNATLIHKPNIKTALLKVDQNILKLDSVHEETVRNLNQPQGFFSIKKTIDYLMGFDGKLIIQTLFVRGFYHGKFIDNTTEEEIIPWLGAIQKIKPEMVMIYTIARDTPIDTLDKITNQELHAIASRVEKLGIKTQVSA